MNDRIAVNPLIHFGKPCIAGTRITVQAVLELLDAGLSFERIIRDYYPDITTKDIQACIQYGTGRSSDATTSTGVVGAR